MNKFSVLTNLARYLISAHKMISVAESCTGGLLSAALTELPGSSKWFDRGFVTYSNEAKKKLFGVSDETLVQQGAVSQAVAECMAEGALKNSLSQIALSITGIAGPTADGTDTPIGTIWFAIARKNKIIVAQKKHFTGSRNMIRRKAVKFALDWLLKNLESER